eukprot:9131750-Ditylum_brightwellii.AAC.1
MGYHSPYHHCQLNLTGQKTQSHQSWYWKGINPTQNTATGILLYRVPQRPLAKCCMTLSDLDWLYLLPFEKILDRHSHWKPVTPYIHEK